MVPQAINAAATMRSFECNTSEIIFFGTQKSPTLGLETFATYVFNSVKIYFIKSAITSMRQFAMESNNSENGNAKKNGMETIKSTIPSSSEPSAIKSKSMAVTKKTASRSTTPKDTARAVTICKMTSATIERG